MVERPTELAWTAKTMGSRPSRSTACAQATSIPAQAMVWTEQCWSGLLTCLLRRPCTKTLQAAINSGLARMQPERPVTA